MNTQNHIIPESPNPKKTQSKADILTRLDSIEDLLFRIYERLDGLQDEVDALKTQKSQRKGDSNVNSGKHQ